MVYLAKDSMGHVTPLEITVHITSDEATEDNLVKEVRGISKEYYDTYKNADYSEEAYKNYGGLHPNSLWYTDPEYRACIEEAFENEENNTPEQVWVFTPEDHVKVKEFITEHSIGNSKEPDALKKFLEEFAYCRKK